MLLPASSSSPAPSIPRPIPASLPGPISIITTVLRTNGIRGLWLGHAGTLLRETGGSTAWFLTREFVASNLISRRPSSGSAKPTPLPWESALSGACAGVAYNVVLFPADTIKSAMQTEEELRPRQNGVARPTFFQTGKAMWKKQGVRGLYSGCGITVARSVPSSALIFLVYDSLKSRFG
jgi:mitochondrial ornithine carrier protein